MNEGSRRIARSGIGPALGAVIIAAGALVLSVAILLWRGGAQREVLDAETARCRKADLPACDSLRSQCIKRSGESCTALAESILASPSPHDSREAVRLLAEACDLRDRSGCLRAATLLAAGEGIPQDAKRAAELRSRACSLGVREACGN